MLAIGNNLQSFLEREHSKRRNLASKCNFRRDLSGRIAATHEISLIQSLRWIEL